MLTHWFPLNMQATATLVHEMAIQLYFLWLAPGPCLPGYGNLGDLNGAAGHLAGHQDLAGHHLATVQLHGTCRACGGIIAGVTWPKNARRAVRFLTEALPSVPWGGNGAAETRGKLRLATCMKAWLRLRGEGRFSLPWSIV